MERAERPPLEQETASAVETTDASKHMEREERVQMLETRIHQRLASADQWIKDLGTPRYLTGPESAWTENPSYTAAVCLNSYLEQPGDAQERLAHFVDKYQLLAKRALENSWSRNEFRNNRIRPKLMQELEKLSSEDFQAARLVADEIPSPSREEILFQLDIAELYFSNSPDHSKPEQHNVALLLAEPALDLLAHQETREAQERLTKKTLPDAIDFLTEAFPAIDKKELERRASGLSIEIIPPTREAKWEKVLGVYQPENNRILLARTKKDDSHTLFHELTHALSQQEDEGVRFADRPSGTAMTFLTEAVVEELTALRMADDTDASYAQERFVLSKLRRKESFGLKGKLGFKSKREELPLSVFVEALFDKKKSLSDALRTRGWTNKEINELLDDLEDHVSYFAKK